MLPDENMELEAAPLITGQAGGAETKTVARWRWWLHVLLLGSLPLFIGTMGIIHRNRTTALLPDNVPGLLRVSVYEMLYPALAFCVVWLASRFTAKQMLLSWRGGLMPVLLGFAYSVVLRIIIVIIAVAVVVVFVLIAGSHAHALEQLRSHTGQLVNAAALTRDPVYFVLCLTLLSFVVAGLREELWRAAMLAGCQALFPTQCGTWRGRAVAVVIVGLLFGLGHTTQGFAGVAVTTLLGVGLGAIMLWRRSIWEAVIAHGFFDATTFAFLYLLAKYHPELLHNL
jgi:membrane protease YdiL (CAAX protease family)